jgi:hypothetical protein
MNRERRGAMDKREFRYLTSELRRYELTEIEERFVDLTERQFSQRGALSEQQETVLRGIVREKAKWNILSLKKRASRRQMQSFS